jgi:hypothetical protein
MELNGLYENAAPVHPFLLHSTDQDLWREEPQEAARCRDWAGSISSAGIRNQS